MPLFDIYGGLTSSEQLLHGLHFMLCCFAVLVGCVPLATAKGSAEHKLAGLIYIPVSAAGLLLAAYMSFNEASFMLFGFSAFCAWLLLSGWRAAHEDNAPKMIDWLIPLGLLALSIIVVAHALTLASLRQSLCLIFFACNGFYLGTRDLRQLLQRQEMLRGKLHFTNAGLNAAFGTLPANTGWLSRHVAGMAGSFMASLSVVVLTLLPVSLHWLWPAALMAMAAVVAIKQRARKRQVKAAMAQLIKPNFTRHPAPAPDIRRAA